VHLDLDHFKEINDLHGHAMGDHVLQVAARRMMGQVRADDVIARVGGDEFVFVLLGANATEGVVNAAARLISKLEEPILRDGHVYNVSASIGATLSRFYEAPRYRAHDGGCRSRALCGQGRRARMPCDA